MLQVFSPQATLVAYDASPQSCRVHAWPGGVQIPQAALQHVSPGLHVTAPHATAAGGGASAAMGAGASAAGDDASAVAEGVAIATGAGTSALGVTSVVA
jgi:hypothetical protein